MKKTYTHNHFSATFTDEGEGGYFSLTGEINGSSGAVGHTIAKIDPRFELLEAMHLCDSKTGEPLHAEANALYWAEQGMVDTLSSHLMIPKDHAKAICGNVLLAKKIGKNAGEKALQEEVERIAGFIQQIKTAITTKNKTVYDIWDALRKVNNKVRCVDEKVRSLDIIHKHNITYQGLLDAAKALANNLKKSVKASSELPRQYAEREAKQVIENHVQLSREAWKKQAVEIYKIAEAIPSDLTEPDEVFDLNDFSEPEKALALAKYLEVDVSIVEEGNDCVYYEATGKEFMVLTDYEADEEWDQRLNSYLDECVLPELPENIRRYFNKDAWKSDAKGDGRGHSLSSYDGCEWKQDVNGITYYIYRV